MKLNYVKTLINETNYSLEEFKTLDMQREIYPKHVANLVKDFQEVGCCLSPLTVILTSVYDKKPTLYIIDGHQRRAAALELSKLNNEPFPLNIIIFRLQDDTLDNIATYLDKTNNMRRDWIYKDYIQKNSGVGTNCDDYKFFAGVKIRLSNLSDSYLLSLLTESCSMKNFKKGQFKRLKNKELLEARICLFEQVKRQKRGTNGLPGNMGIRKFISCISNLNATEIYAFIDILKEFLIVNSFSKDEDEIEITTNQLIEQLYETI